MAEFVPLFQETAASIRARLDADANSGLADTDPDRIDTREGTFYYDVTQAVVLELARIWDALGTEVPSAALPNHAWGEYLDDHAATFGLARKPGTQATGSIQVTGAAELLVGQGSVFATEPATATADPIEFETTESLTLSEAIDQPAAPAVSVSSGGSFAEAGDHYYFVAARSEWGLTLPSAASDIVSVSAGQEVNVTWSPVAGAVEYAIYRGDTDVADEAVLVGTVTDATFTDAGNTSFAIAPNTEDRSAGGEVAVRAAELGVGGNVSAGAITNAADADPDIYSVNNADPTLGGTEVESDEDLRSRILAEYSHFAGGGTVADYKRWALEYAGVGKVLVQPVWQGAGTVLLAVADSDGNALQDYGTVANGNVILGLQEQLDPTRLAVGTGTVSGSTVTDSTKDWVTDQWVGKSVVISNKYAVISANSGTALTTSGGWFVLGTNASTSAPSSGAYRIGVTKIESGYGYAPIGAAVTVKSAEPVTVDISATISLKTGYTLTTEQSAIEAVLDRYFASLAIGDPVVFRKIQSVFFDSPGVGDVAALFLSATEAGASNVAEDIVLDALTTPQIARRGTVSLSVGP